MGREFKAEHHGKVCLERTLFQRAAGAPAAGARSDSSSLQLERIQNLCITLTRSPYARRALTA